LLNKGGFRLAEAQVSSITFASAHNEIRVHQHVNIQLFTYPLPAFAYPHPAYAYQP